MPFLPSAQSTNEDLLLAYLHANESHCPSCNYNLHHLTSSLCPECGQPLKLQVALQTPKIAAFIFGLLGLALSISFPILLDVLLLIISFVDGSASSLRFIIGFTFPISILLSIPFIIWYRKRGHLFRSTNKYRWPLAFFCWVPVPIVVVLCYIIIEISY